tara:strand:- start:597 stop:1229 length:633 start_codon:yes stop_codon:yes gene_type:complete
MIYTKKVAFETAKILLQINAIKFNTKTLFNWSSGIKSPIYCDNRIILSYPTQREYIIDKMCDLIRKNYKDNFTIAGVATGGIGIGSMISQKLNLPFIYVRSQPKEHGRKNQIEGYLNKKSKVLVVEDLISTGNSSINVVKCLQNNEANVIGLVSIFNYNFNISKINFDKLNITSRHLTDLKYLIEYSLENKYLNQEDLVKIDYWKKNIIN